LIEESTIRTRLCPQCANSIQQDATNCPYCKADLLVHFIPKWLNRDGLASEPRLGSDKTKRNSMRNSIPPQVVWITTTVAIALLAFFAGGYIKRSQLLSSSQDNLRELQAKTQMIQSQEAQLAKEKQQLDDNSKQFTELKTKLDENQKELSLAQQRLAVATRELDRLKTTRSVIATGTRRRTPQTSVAGPVPTVTRQVVEPGVYETTRPTSVYEDPSSASRVLSQINRGTRINVVSSAGEWLQVRSNRGNPPGYVRSDDARLIARPNS
jgi:multidrug efflux pump subunit AcrA (membrane-fusion protein)